MGEIKFTAKEEKFVVVPADSTLEKILNSMLNERDALRFSPNLSTAKDYASGKEKTDVNLPKGYSIHKVIFGYTETYRGQGVFDPTNGVLIGKTLDTVSAVKKPEYTKYEDGREEGKEEIISDTVQIEIK